MKTVDEVINYYKRTDISFWSKSSKRATNRILFFQLPINWRKTISSHFKEFTYVQNNHGAILKDFKDSEFSEAFFGKIGEYLFKQGEISQNEKELMGKAIYNKGYVPEINNEYAKAMYLNACLKVGSLKPQSVLDDIARKGSH